MDVDKRAWGSQIWKEESYRQSTSIYPSAPLYQQWLTPDSESQSDVGKWMPRTWREELRGNQENTRRNFPKVKSSKVTVERDPICFLLKEFSANSVLHGFVYLGDSKRPLVERLVWAVIMIVSLVVASLLIRRVWDKWITSPVIVSFSERPKPIFEIPFPAVTICPQIKYKKRSPFEEGLTKDLKTAVLDNFTRRYVDNVMLLCREDVELWSGVSSKDYRRFTDEDVYHILKSVATLDDSVESSIPAYLSCNYGYKNDCGNNIQNMFTADGWCQTFNLMPRHTVFTDVAIQKQFFESQAVEDWSLEDGFKVAEEVDTVPYRITSTVFDRGLVLMLESNTNDIDSQCRTVQGFKVMLTNPAEFPRTNDKSFYISMTGLTQIVVEPRMIETSESLRSYTPEQRQCFFSSERKLAFFSQYTQSNCEIECLTNFTLKECNCVEFFMPRASETQICGYGSSACVRRAELRHYNESMTETMKKSISNNTCNCMPECTSIQYHVEIIRSDLYEGTESTTEYDKDSRNISNLRLAIGFKTTEVLTKQRGPLYDYTDFTANCGGLLGLFFGFSLLSVIEIVYFFTLRLWINIRNKKHLRNNE